MGNKVPHCDFCGRGADDGVDVIVGPNGSNICGDCAKQVIEIIEKEQRSNCVRLVKDEKSNEVAQVSNNSNDETKESEKIPIGKIPSPSEMVSKLNEYIIGQEDTKKTLAVAVYNHYCRIAASEGYNADGTKMDDKSIDDDLKDVEVEKSNVMLLGPTGCGKTLFAKTLARMLNVPFAIADATTLTEAGYVGEDVENVVRYLYNNADNNKELTARGIIYVDEIDKIASKTQNTSITRDVSGEGVQQALLKLIEGTTCRFPPKGGRKHPDQEYVEIDTSNILFIVGGAFVGIDKIVKKRIHKNDNKSIGFGFVQNEEEDKKKDDEAKSENAIAPEDLVEFGLIPELIGRIPIVSQMRELTEEELVKVLTEPKNCLVKQYKKLLRMSGKNITFTTNCLKELAKKAIERKTGARGLRAEMELRMKDIMYKAPDDIDKHDIVIDSLDNNETKKEENVLESAA